MKENINANNNKWDDSHRPWALPTLPWTMKQTWSNLLFAHYPIQYDVLHKLIPEALTLDSFNGTYWVGIVPFQMSEVGVRGLPQVPGTDRFPELNVRTYVTLDGKPGVYFFSLDAANRLAVFGARTLYYLPYWYASMSLKENDSNFEFTSIRYSDSNIAFSCNYRPISEPFQPAKGTFEEWLVERYCFYTLNASGIPLRCDILHEPWTLQHAEAEITHNTILTKQGILTENVEPIYHFAKKIEVRAWPLVHHATSRFSI